MINHGGRAFPFSINERGITLRQYYAAKAMVAILNADSHYMVNDRELAIKAFKIADAMISECGDVS